MSTTATNNLSTSRLRSSTPIKAITSTIVNRASPLVPLSTQTYEPLVKSVLRHRLSRIFLQSSLLCWVVNAAWTVWQTGGPSRIGIGGVVTAPFQVLTLLSSVMLWLTAALPVIVLRKFYLTPQRTPATSPRGSLKAALAKSSTRPAFITYATSAVVLAVIHAALTYATELSVRGDPKLFIFVKSKKHPRYLNGRLLFLLFSQTTLAASFLFRNILRDRFVYRWPPAGVKHSSHLPEILVAALVALISASVTLPLATTLFALARFLLPILYKLPVLPIFLRPFTAHFLRGSYTFVLPFRHFSLFFRAWFLGITTSFIWECSESFFENMVSEPIIVGQSSPTLVSGVTSSDLTMKFLAFSELNTIATDKSAGASAQRIALFGDQKNSLNLWSHLVRESLLLLGHDYQHFLRRGAPPPAPPLATPAKLTSASSQIPATPTPLIRKSILRSTPQSPTQTILDSIASNGPIAQAVDAGASVAHIPELFRSIEEKVVPVPSKTETNLTTAKSWVARSKDAVNLSLRTSLKKHAPAKLQEESERLVLWWREERISRVADACLPRRELDVVVVEVITHLVCASLTEDRYGVVQRDIPKILEALLSFLSAIEEYQIEVNAKYVAPAVDANLSPKELEAVETVRIEVERAGELLGYVGDGLKEGVARIVKTFGDKLTAFKFPPRTAQKLQGFLDYC